MVLETLAKVPTWVRPVAIPLNSSSRRVRSICLVLMMSVAQAKIFEKVLPENGMGQPSLVGRGYGRGWRMHSIDHDPRRLRRSLLQIAAGITVTLLIAFVIWATGIAASEILGGDLTSVQRMWGAIGFIAAFALLGIAARLLQ
jgi:hypothetical protein